MSTLTAPAVSPEVVTPIKPSEALRLGRLTRPKRITGAFFRGEHGACALGAIGIGLGFAPEPGPMGWSFSFDHVVSLMDSFTTRAPCPTDCCPELSRIGYLIGHLNDGHGWSDNQIVTWLESLGL